MTCTRFVLRTCARIRAPRCYNNRGSRSFSCSGKLSVWRPSKDDVQRLSQGQAAKKRGVGSREVPHRLNADEAKVFQLAKDKGFLALRGSGYRRERKGSPLANIYRQWCDALGVPCILVEQDSQGGLDSVVVDLSPLRTTHLTEVIANCHAAAAELGCTPADASQLHAPFTVLLPLGTVHSLGAAEEGAATRTAAATLTPADPFAWAASEAQPAAPASTSAALPGTDVGGGLGSWDHQPADTAALQSSRRVAAAEGTVQEPQGAQPGMAAEDQGEGPSELMLSAPIWRQAPHLLGYRADRNTSKALGKLLATQLLNRRA